MAQTSADYARAIGEMLLSLRDRGTHVVTKRTRVQPASSAPTSTRWTEDSTLVIAIPDPTDVLGEPVDFRGEC